MFLDRRILSPILLVATVAPYTWATPKITPSLSVSEQYTDNAGLTAQDEEDSFIHQVAPGISIEDSGAKTDYLVDYNFKHSSYSNSNFDDRNENSLNASVNRYEFNRSLKLFANARILNVETDIGSPRFGDGDTGSERTETRTSSAGFDYSTGARQYYDLKAGALYRHTETDDDNVNVDSISANLRAINGKRFDNAFWDFGGTYTEDDNENRKAINDGLIGVNITSTLGVFAQANREENDLESGSNFVTESWGLGLRVTRANSSLSVAYNTYEKGGQDDNRHFLTANASWNPTRRTSLSANYGERFFGETYGLELTHQTRKLKHTLKYSDSVSDFSESIVSGQLVTFLICPKGNTDPSECKFPTQADIASFDPSKFELVEADIPLNSISESQVLNRTLSYSSVYSTAKSKITGTILWNRSKTLDSQFSSRDYTTQLSGTVSWNWQLGSRTDLTLSSTAREVEDRETVGTTVTTRDFTQRISLQRSFSKNVNGTVSYSHSDRRGDDSSQDIRENRISTSIIANF
ncbi:TIGR03016 family PEP-CTERM system-associated outer membrane protein [Hahella ganghwensis]|uniref:TIGR03016 family PEP-CTERM system-associated outer membrane protein n=1 Tax=Hahella ganghwensis TaxID=286420 RepID=UPI000360ABF1|nr:TIGR03016 family PEP-CTERM system-associated outer membrane protein [Hahella ganghwensis]